MGGLAPSKRSGYRPGTAGLLELALGCGWRGLTGSTRPRSLGTYDELATGELLAVLRRSRARLARDPNSREFRDQLDHERCTSTERLATLRTELRNLEAESNSAVYELHELTASARALIEADPAP